MKFRETVIAFDKVIKQQGGKTALYLTQAYVAPHKQAKPENIRTIDDFMVSVGNEVGALVIPVARPACANWSSRCVHRARRSR